MRRTQQKNKQVRVIIGNPPYSIGQRRQNDNAQNTVYPKLRQLIEDSYADQSTAVTKRSLYDSYIMAIKWASCRIGDKGIIAFVTNAGWIDSKTTAGMRKSLEDEFSTLYVIHLRGNLRTSGEEAKQEGESVFELGTRTPIALSIMIKNPNKTKDDGKIHFFDIGDYKSRAEKLSFLSTRRSVTGIGADEFKDITADKYGDWVQQRSEKFDEFISCGDKKRASARIFKEYSLGVVTNRDAWAYNFRKTSLEYNIERMINTYNNEREKIFDDTDKSEVEKSIGDLRNHINQDPAKISWTTNLLNNLTSNMTLTFDSTRLHKSLYRPFTKQWLYYDRRLNERVSRMPQIFPIDVHGIENRVIMTDSNYRGRGMFALMSDTLPDLHCNGDSQCFPLCLYSNNRDDPSKNLYSENEWLGDSSTRSITSAGVKTLTAGFRSQSFAHEDVFYYIYGVLHSYDYLNRYKNNLSKQLPRIPKVKREEDFWKFSEAGRKLGDLHCGYEDVAPYKVRFAKGNDTPPIVGDDKSYFRVRKMKFARRGDKSTVIYNNNITLTDIPLEAYDYMINKKSALEWVMDRQCVRTDKRSGIINDANEYALETIGNAAYPLQLFQKVITVSLETMKIVKSLPELDIDD